MTHETTPYSAQPGTLPFRALAHLETLPPGAEITSAQLAEVLGVAPSSILSALTRAFEAGAVFKRKKDPHPKSPLFWSLPASPAAPRGGAVAGGTGETPAAAPRSQMSAASPKARAAAIPATRQQGGELRIALWSDGVLQLQRGGVDVAAFNAAEAAAICRYLARLPAGNPALAG